MYLICAKQCTMVATLAMNVRDGNSSQSRSGQQSVLYSKGRTSRHLLSRTAALVWEMADKRLNKQPKHIGVTDGPKGDEAETNGIIEGDDKAAVAGRSKKDQNYKYVHQWKIAKFLTLLDGR